MNEPERTWLRNGTPDWLWTEAERAGVPIAVLATDTLREISAIAERLRATRLLATGRP